MPACSRFWSRWQLLMNEKILLFLTSFIFMVDILKILNKYL